VKVEGTCHLLFVSPTPHYRAYKSGPSWLSSVAALSIDRLTFVLYLLTSNFWPGWRLTLGSFCQCWVPTLFRSRLRCRHDTERQKETQTTTDTIVDHKEKTKLYYCCWYSAIVATHICELSVERFQFLGSFGKWRFCLLNVRFQLTYAFLKTLNLLPILPVCNIFITIMTIITTTINQPTK